MGDIRRVRFLDGKATDNKTPAVAQATAFAGVCVCGRVVGFVDEAHVARPKEKKMNGAEQKKQFRASTHHNNYSCLRRMRLLPDNSSDRGGIIPGKHDETYDWKSLEHVERFGLEWGFTLFRAHLVQPAHRQQMSST